MYSKFESLEEEKKQRILNAAMKEFADKGYDRASTNKIVEDAGIAKGLLFHYFKSKKQLFLYLYDCGLGLVTREVFQKIDFAESDFFKRMLKAQIVKIELIQVYPDCVNFLMKAYLEKSSAVRQELDDRNGDLLLASFQRAMEGIDTSVFRSDLDISLVIKTVAWAYEGFANAYMEQLKNAKATEIDYPPLLAASEQYTEFLKKCFYR